ncbi:hypothetical protein D9M70_426870 [compost metagenome]
MHLVGLAADIGALEQAILDVGITRGGQQGGEPVEAGEHLVGDFARLDLARPADQRRHPEGTFPVGVLLVAERRGRRVRPGPLVRAVVGGVDDDGVLGNLQVIQGLEQLADVAIVLEHAVGVLVARHAALPLHGLAHMGEGVHAGGVHPDEERLVGLDLLLDEVDGTLGGFVVDGFHALGGQRAGVLDLAVGKAAHHASGRGGLGEFGIVLRPVGTLGLLFGIQVVEVAEELVETMFGRQVFVAVAQVVLAELAGGVAVGLERLGDGDVARLQADRRAGHADLGQAGAQRALPGDEGRAAGGAAVLRVVVGEHHAFPGQAVDVRRRVADHAVAIGTDVGLADVVAEDHQDVRFFRGHGQRRKARE